MTRMEIAKGARTRKTNKSPFAPIEDAVDAIRRGGIVIVVDDEDRENEDRKSTRLNSSH